MSKILNFPFKEKLISFHESEGKICLMLWLVPNCMVKKCIFLVTSMLLFIKLCKHCSNDMLLGFSTRISKISVSLCPEAQPPSAETWNTMNFSSDSCSLVKLRREGLVRQLSCFFWRCWPFYPPYYFCPTYFGFPLRRDHPSYRHWSIFIMLGIFYD